MDRKRKGEALEPTGSRRRPRGQDEDEGRDPSPTSPSTRIWTPARWWPPSYTRDEGDTTTLEKTLAGQGKSRHAAPTAEDPAECVTDNLSSRSVLKGSTTAPGTRISEPNRKVLALARAGRPASHQQTRLLSGVAKEAFKLRAEIVERSFRTTSIAAHTWLRGRENVHKRYLLHVDRPQSESPDAQTDRAGTPREAVAGYGCICVLIALAGAVLATRTAQSRRRRNRVANVSRLKPGQ